jgi:hypothetical protein
MQNILLSLFLFLFSIVPIHSENFFGNGFVSTSADSSYSEKQESDSAVPNGEVLQLDASFFQDPASLSYTVEPEKARCDSDVKPI